MFGLTQLGIVHTSIALIAVVAALISFAQYRQINPHTMVGKTYIVTTAITCLTGFGIFQHGGFGNPHVLGIITLAVLVTALTAGKTQVFGKASKYVEAVSYTATFFFHLIPAIVETTTRLPAGAPLFASADAPELKAATGVVLLGLLIAATVQVQTLRRSKV